jgi:hypothetical protein
MSKYLDKEFSEIYEKLDSCPYFDVDYIQYFKAILPVEENVCERDTRDLYIEALESLEKDRNRWRYADTSDRTRTEIYCKTLRRVFVIKKALTEVDSALHTILEGIDI